MVAPWRIETMWLAAQKPEATRVWMAVAESREQPMECKLVPHVRRHSLFRLSMMYRRGVVGEIGGCILEMTVEVDWLFV